MEEIEVKFLDINPAEIEKKLRGIGAEKVGDCVRLTFAEGAVKRSA